MISLLKRLNLLKKVKSQPQNNQKKYQSAYKIHTETCKINWRFSMETIYNLIRGLNPYPAAWTYFTNDGNEIRSNYLKLKKNEHAISIGKHDSDKKT